MTSVGLGSRITSWCGSYLADRRFSVRVGHASSDCPSGACPSGALQGSRIAPLLFSIYIQDLGSRLRELGVRYAIYAAHVLREIRDPSDTLRLQRTIQGVADWATANRMLISVPKCAMIKSKPDDTSYFLNGHSIPEVSTYRDLGVHWDSDLKFRSHITEISRSAGLLSNMILRAFIIKRPDLYISLFGSLVVSRLSYCSEIWRPAYSKDKFILDSVRDKFARRVARRCGVDVDSLPPLPTVDELHRKADISTPMRVLKSDQAASMFSLRRNGLRSERQLFSAEIANTSLVNNLFAWRLPRIVRDDAALCTFVNTLSVKEF